MDLTRLKQSVRKYEGLSLTPYHCPSNKLTIGYGRNLEDNGITLQEAEQMLERDLLNIKLELEDSIRFFHKLDHVRQNVLIEMAYNMGISNLLEFKNTLNFMQKSDFVSASVEMLNSKWHRDFLDLDMRDGKRTKTLRSEYLAIVMMNGVY